MSDDAVRLTGPGTPPTPEVIEAWLGRKAYKYWLEMSVWISRSYPGIFNPEWLYGGKKHGWSLRYKKSKSFCTLIPEKGRLVVLIVFGADERLKVETIRKEISALTMRSYDDAKTYHDGKWLKLHADKETTLADIRKLLAMKRRILAGEKAAE